jgi:hypothetical protein
MTNSSLNTLIKQLVYHQAEVTPAELTGLAGGVGLAPFAASLLEVDEPLWGSFWHFDVLSPGYRLPAVELALLRATRLDQNWPAETTPEQFLADLHQAIQHPLAGIWTVQVAEEPCAVFAAPLPSPLVTAAWYCATTGCLHAGYRVAPANLYLEKAQCQRPLQVTDPQPSPEPAWLESVVEQLDQSEPLNLVSQLDREILRWRLGHRPK